MIKPRKLISTIILACGLILLPVGCASRALLIDGSVTATGAANGHAESRTTAGSFSTTAGSTAQATMADPAETAAPEATAAASTSESDWVIDSANTPDAPAATEPTLTANTSADAPAATTQTPTTVSKATTASPTTTATSSTTKATLPPEPTPAPTPEPTPAPTPEPTPEPTPAPAPTTLATTTTAPDVTAQIIAEIFQLTNQQRAANGLPALAQGSAALDSAARIRAEESAAKFSHERPNGTMCFTVWADLGIKYTTAGENLAWGSAGITCAQIMNSWMKSEGHRANILSANFGTLSVGYYNDAATGKQYWSQLFMN